MLTPSDFVKALREIGYTSLTPVQKLAMPKVLSGKDTLIVAPTGSGKTEAAIIPLFYKIWENRPSKISLLYFTPLRALNRDLETRLKKLGNALGITVMTRHGDTTERQRKEIVKSPPDALITTPETFQYLLVNKNYLQLFENVKWVVVDELQEMLDEKRGYELSILLYRLKRVSKNKVQTIGLSATIGDVELAKRYLSNSDVELVKADIAKEYRIDLVVPKVDEKMIGEIGNTDPYLFSRLEMVKEIVQSNSPVLIFTNTRETAEFLASELQSRYNLKVAVHHGSLSREVREGIEREFKEGNLDALVATSSLELGIDIGRIGLVIQYMSPRQVIRLLQRVGRSGHSIGKVSRGVVIPGDYVYDVLECKAIIDLSREGYLESPSTEQNPLDVLAHEIAGMVLQGMSDLYEIVSVVKESVYFKRLTDEEVRKVLDYMESARIVKQRDGRLVPGHRLWKYYYGTNMIPDSIRSYSVVNVANNAEIGKLDEEFAAMLEEDSVFILGGKLWKVVSVENGRIFVDKAELKKGVLPSWFGESIPVEKEVAKRVYSYLVEAISGKGSELEEVNRVVEEYKRRGYPELRYNDILVEVMGDLLVVHSPFGSKGNNTLGALLSFYLSRIKGIRNSYRNDPYHIVIASVLPISREEVAEALSRLKALRDEEAVEIVKRAIIESPQFKWKLYTEAERFGAIDPDSEAVVSSTLLKQFTDTVIGEEAVKELMVKSHDLSVIHDLKEYNWIVVNSPSPSPLAKEFLDRLLVTDAEETPVMLEVFKRRLLSKQVKLICLVCGWNREVKVESAPEKCEKCGSVFLAATYVEDKDSLEVVRKAIKGEKMKRGEVKKLEELRTVASLFSQYKRSALMALAVRGVGPSNLGRALSRLSDGEEAFLKGLLEEEKRFLRNRKYWQ
ncbi:MAG: DEAD/DEAH box helicase [Candidatus Aramenus sp.]|nr:DEAD/DEAH box helicase [Candidatus Aramenus sp.]